MPPSRRQSPSSPGEPWLCSPLKAISSLGGEDCLFSHTKWRAQPRGRDFSCLGPWHSCMELVLCQGVVLPLMADPAQTGPGERTQGSSALTIVLWGREQEGRLIDQPKTTHRAAKDTWHHPQLCASCSRPPPPPGHRPMTLNPGLVPAGLQLLLRQNPFISRTLPSTFQLVARGAEDRGRGPRVSSMRRALFGHDGTKLCLKPADLYRRCYAAMAHARNKSLPSGSQHHS